MLRHELRLLGKAALEGRITVKQGRDRGWPRDHARLRVLERAGRLQWSGTRAGPHLGGIFAVWTITEAGRARLADIDPPVEIVRSGSRPAGSDLRGEAR